jgi:hypothetical protein
MDVFVFAKIRIPVGKYEVKKEKRLKKVRS